MQLFQKRDVSITSPPKWLVEYLNGGESLTGESVTVENSLQVAAVLAGFTILCEDTSSLPLIYYRRLKRGKERAYDSPYYTLMHDAPNPEHTSMVFRELMMGHLLGWGNFYGQFIWDSKGVVREIWPLKPSQMQVVRDKGERKYLYTLANNTKRAFRQDEILHIPAFGFDGLVGYSRIALSRNSIGLSKAAERYGSRVFANDARPSVVLMHPGKIATGDDQKRAAAADRIKKGWNDTYQGADKAGKVAILEENMTLQEIGFPAKDAQYLESRQFSISEIARIFRIPPHMMGDITNSTSWGSGIEQQEIGYLSHTLRPWLTRIEQQLNKDLLLPAERTTTFFEHLVEAMLRGDTAARFEAYAKAITNGFMTRNEARERENMNPLEGLDDPLVPLNMGNGNGAPSQPPTKGRAHFGGGASFSIQPLLKDTAERIVRRESKEIADAVKRWVEKNKPEKFTAWLEEFYKGIHPDYIRSSFQPFVEAGYMDGERISIVADEYCDMRGAAQLEEMQSMVISSDELMKMIEE